MLKQVSVFAENKKGRLAALMEIISGSKIDIRGLTIADTTDFGIVRMIVDDAESAVAILKENGCIASVADVLAFTISDVSGALNSVISLLGKNDISIEYCYSLMGNKEKTADIIIKTDEPAKAEKVLSENGIALL